MPVSDGAVRKVHGEGPSEIAYRENRSDISQAAVRYRICLTDKSPGLDAAERGQFAGTGAATYGNYHSSVQQVLFLYQVTIFLSQMGTRNDP